MELILNPKKNLNSVVLEHCYLGAPYSIENKYGIFVPVLTRNKMEKNKYTYFDEQNSSEISFEETGVVGKLQITNNSKKVMLFLNGEIFEGAKQDRMLNSTYIVEPNSELMADVSCIERNRWSYNKNFKKSDYMASYSTKSIKDLNINSHKMGHRINSSHQEEVWENIRRKERSFNTGTLNDSENKIFKTIEEELNSLKTNITCHSNQVGLIVIQKKYIGFDLIPSISTYAKVHGRLVKSHLTESIETVKRFGDRNNNHLTKKYIELMNDFFKLLSFEKEFEDRNKTNLQEQIYLHKAKAFSASSYHYKGDLIHLTGFQDIKHNYRHAY